MPPVRLKDRKQRKGRKFQDEGRYVPVDATDVKTQQGFAHPVHMNLTTQSVPFPKKTHSV